MEGLEVYIILFGVEFTILIHGTIGMGKRLAVWFRMCII